MKRPRPAARRRPAATAPPPAVKDTVSAPPPPPAPLKSQIDDPEHAALKKMIEAAYT
jgi:hypothetical protein